jgi:hypothetical protein
MSDSGRTLSGFLYNCHLFFRSGISFFHDDSFFCTPRRGFVNYLYFFPRTAVMSDYMHFLSMPPGIPVVKIDMMLFTAWAPVVFVITMMTGPLH